MNYRIIGSIAALLTMFAFFPQIAKALSRKSVKDVSIVTLLQLTAGISLWIIYGVYLKDPIIIIANSVTLASMLALLYLYFIYGRRR